MRKYIFACVLIVMAVAGVSMTSSAERLSQRIVPTECVVNPGEPDQSFLSEDACYDLLHPLIPDPPVIISPQPNTPRAPDTGFFRREFYEGSAFLILLTVAFIVTAYARYQSEHHLPN